jgi:hypothetical protein
MGARFTSLRLEISWGAGGTGNIVINFGVVEKARNFFDRQKL